MTQEKAIVMCVEFFDSRCESDFYHFFMPEKISPDGSYQSPEYFEKSFEVIIKLKGDTCRRLMETYQTGGYKDLLIDCYVQNKICFLFSMIKYADLPAFFWDVYKIVAFYLHEQEVLLKKMQIDMTNREKYVQEKVNENCLYFLGRPFREYDKKHWAVIESNLKNHEELKTICEHLKQNKPWQHIEAMIGCLQ